MFTSGPNERLIEVSSAAIVVGIVLPVIGYANGNITDTTATLLIRAYGAMASVLLVVVTWFTMRQNKRLINERNKDREKPIQRDLLTEIIQPSIDIINENQKNLVNGTVNWHEDSSLFHLNTFFISGHSEFNNFDRDPVAFSLFKEEYPKLSDQMEELDSLTVELEGEARALINTISKLLNNFIGEKDEEHNFWGGGPDTDEIANSFINQRNFGDVNSHIVEKYGEDIRGILEREVSDELKEFLSVQHSYFEKSSKLESDLVEVREEIQEEYGISAQNIK